MIRNIFEKNNAILTAGLDDLGEDKNVLFRLVNDYVRSRWPRWLTWLPLIWWTYLENYTSRSDHSICVEWCIILGSSIYVRLVRTRTGWDKIEIDDYQADYENLAELKVLLKENLPRYTIRACAWGDEIDEVVYRF